MTEKLLEASPVSDEERKARKREATRRWFAKKYADPKWRAEYQAKQRARYAKLPDIWKSAAKRQRLAIKRGPDWLRTQQREQLRRWRAGKRAQNPTYFRDLQLRAKYGIGIADLDQMLAAQSRACAICHDPIDEISRRLDHDHATGKVRALLCHNCNVMLGHCRDSVAILEEAINYLSRHTATKVAAYKE